MDERSVTSLTDILPRKILCAIFAEVENPSELAVLSDIFLKIAKDPYTVTAWIRKHPTALTKWATSWAEARTTSRNNNKINPAGSNAAFGMQMAFPACALKEISIALLLDTTITKNSFLGEPESRRNIIRALWALACFKNFVNVCVDALAAAAPALTAEFDEISWKETLFAAVGASHEMLRFLNIVILRYPDSIDQFIPDACVFSAITGKLQALTILADRPSGAKTIQTRGLEMLRIAAGNGHRHLVLYLVGRGGFSEHHDQLIKTYRGLHVLLEAAEKRILDSKLFDVVMESWLFDTDPPEPTPTAASVNSNSGAQNQFALRWRMSCELACERNHLQLLQRLLDYRKAKAFVDSNIVKSGSLKIRLRMFALATANGNNELAGKLLELAAREDTDVGLATIEAGQIDMLAGMGAFKTANERCALLLKRYCHIIDSDLAPQLGLTVNDDHAWRSNVSTHRLAAVEYLCTSDVHFLESIEKIDLNDQMWSAFKLGYIEVAVYLKETCGILVEWMDTASVWSLSEVASQNLTISPSDAIPPAITMALFETLGGSWTVGVDNANNGAAGNGKTSPSNTDIGALLVAAEASKDANLGAKLKVVTDYEAASRQMSRDASFLKIFHPRMIINPEDKMWTKFLDGKLDAADKSEGFSWMEPKKEDTTDFGNEANNIVNFWRDNGLKQERENEELSFYLGLGGKLPETEDAAQKAKEIELARQIHAEY
ncbi:hypothetical protein HK100_012139 [Physocladia obscura]|uniref:Uncharacterized protein n=1 Tax=Physocladia obscura TaxID=109957 RepID=A0AAD5T0A0_9FUNG|nr:hypothetical protein HK100_012139 [Physocladia obscura]